MRKILFIIVLIASCISTYAQVNFSAVSPSGHTLYYKVGSYNFDGNSVTVYGNNQNLTGSLTIPSSVTYNGVNYTVTVIDEYAFNGCSNLTSVIMSNQIKYIGSSAFSGCIGLSSVTMSNTLVYVGMSAFGNCSSLTSITIPDSVYLMEGNPFPNCSGLLSISVSSGNPYYDSRGNCNAIIQTSTNELVCGCRNTIIPNTVTGIWGNAFRGCTYLTTITIPKHVSFIMPYAFGDCTSLSSVIFLADSCVYAGDGYQKVFYNCNNLTSITFGGGVKVIPNYLLFGCTAITSVTIPDSVISIGAGAFRGCTGLSSVTIPSMVTNIGEHAFNGCSNITEITSLPSVAPLLGSSNTFSGVSSTIAVHIPCGSQMSYYSRWSYFSNFIESEGFSINAVSADETMGQVNVLQEPTCQTPTASVYAAAFNGYRFDHWNDGVIDNPRTLLLNSDTVLVAYFAFETFDTIFIHDTTYINVHDTTIVRDTLTLVDTIMVTNTEIDTIYLPQYIHDTTQVYIHDTIYLPQYIYDTTVVFNTDTLWLHDTVFVYDTIYIHDTIVVGVDEVDAINAKVYINNGQIVVEGAEGNTVGLYDAVGRLLATRQDDYSALRFEVPATGTYLIKVGHHPARRVVVVR